MEMRNKFGNLFYELYLFRMRKILFLFLLVSVMRIDAQEVIPVTEEPLHKNVFENEYLRVLDVRIPPGDTTKIHKHATASVFIILHQVRQGSQVILESRGTGVPSADRRITFESFYNQPRIHRVWNSDTSLFHAMDIEVLTKGDKNIGESIAIDGFRQLFDASLVRTYRVTLKAKQEMKLKRNGPVFIVGLNNANKIKVNKKLFTAEGDFLFVLPNEKIELKNGDEKEYSFAFLELK